MKMNNFYSMVAKIATVYARLRGYGFDSCLFWNLRCHILAVVLPGLKRGWNTIRVGTKTSPLFLRVVVVWQRWPQDKQFGNAAIGGKKLSIKSPVVLSEGESGATNSNVLKKSEVAEKVRVSVISGAHKKIWVKYGTLGHKKY